MAETGNLYDILGLKRYASIDEVKVTFRRLAVKYHPDKNPGNEEFEELFKQMVAAYNVLSDEEAKRNYDLRLSGFYTYQKVESEEEKLAKRREKVRQMRQQLKEKEEREIIEVYEAAKTKLPYKWRYAIAATTTVLALFTILSNWYNYDVLGHRESAFFRMLFAYILSLYTVVFFLKSLFLKWNAENITKPFGFNIRNRITTFFVVYVFLMFNFSFNVPKYYKRLHMAAYSQTVNAEIRGRNFSEGLLLVYEVNGKTIIKEVDVPNRYSKDYTMRVTVRYAKLHPGMVEVANYGSAFDI